MSEPRRPGLSRANGEHRDNFPARHANGYGHDAGQAPAAGEVDGAGTASYDPAATQYGELPDGRSYAEGDVPGYDEGATRAARFEGYDYSAIGGTTTYGAGSPAGPPPGSVRGSGPAAEYGGGEGGEAGSTYRVGRDGSVKKLGVDTETGLPPVGGAVPPPRSSSSARGPRRARLQLKHIDPWSAMKFSLVMSVAMFLVWMIAVGLLYGVLSGMGVFDKVNSLYDQVHGGSLLTGSFVLGSAAVVGAINIVLMTALATVGAWVYNLCSDLVGGLELTLSERD